MRYAMRRRRFVVGYSHAFKKAIFLTIKSACCRLARIKQRVETASATGSDHVAVTFRPLRPRCGASAASQGGRATDLFEISDRRE